MREKYDLKKMLEEIEEDVIQVSLKKGKMSQDMIQTMMLDNMKKKKDRR